MSSDPDQDESSAPTKDEAPARDEAELKPRRKRQPADAPPSAHGASPDVGRLNVLVFSLSSLCLIAFGLWLVSAGKAYREEYAQSTQGWRVGTSRSVEITLVKEDKHKLGCASDKQIAGLRCAYRADGRKAEPFAAEGPQILQPYNTVGNEFLLGAGLWSSPDMKGALPGTRFVAVCTYNIKGITKAASTRFDAHAQFSPMDKTSTVGTLTDCTIPR